MVSIHKSTCARVADVDNICTCATEGVLSHFKWCDYKIHGTRCNCGAWEPRGKQPPRNVHVQAPGYVAVRDVSKDQPVTWADVRPLTWREFHGFEGDDS